MPPPGKRLPALLSATGLILLLCLKPWQQHSGKALDPVLPILSRLEEKPERQEALVTLRDLGVQFSDMPAGQAVSVIRSFLQSGQDRATGLPFDIGAGGTLAGWPTLRVFLLDFLLSLDPAAAAEVSRTILSNPTTADEWAVSLRNVARGEAPEDTPYLRDKTEELIRNPKWMESPSIGYLNAFDILVHTGATGSTPLLSELIRNKERRDLAHASFLTLDRLVQRQPAEMLSLLAGDRTLHHSRPEMAAQQFARADLRDPAQRRIVESWLLDPSRSETELRSFSGIYPNRNQFVSSNLLTSQEPFSGEDLRAHDLEVSAIIRSWQQDPAFQAVQQHLRTMASRLDAFLSSPPSIPDPP